MSKHTPATPLPWKFPGGCDFCDIWTDDGKRWVCATSGMDTPAEKMPSAEQDAAYIAHAANAYPKLVEALRDVLPYVAMGQAGVVQDRLRGPLRAILRELGDE